ncbi:MAG TPA: hypothetical protein VHO03_20245 [Ignavibacteriales bacterium]|nr:hypothetical protein [Ignavibacteriales bacterium]
MDVQKKLDVYRLVLKLVREVSERRKYWEFLDRSGIFEAFLHDLSNTALKSDDTSHDYEVVFSELKNRFSIMIDELIMLTKIEMRETLFPLPDIKKEAHEMGESYLKNYMQWLKYEKDITPEEIINILEDDLYKLNYCKDLLGY